MVRRRTSIRRAPGRTVMAGTATVVAVLCATALAAACAPPPPEPATGPSPNDAPAAGDPAYVGPGPYAAGVTTLDVAGRKVEVWYPVDPDDVGPTPPDVYFIRDFVSQGFQDLLPPEVDPPYETDAYRDLLAVPGDHPFVLFSHGFASFRLQSTFLTTHLASWGFVVASPEYLERGLAAVLGEPPPDSRPDTVTADQAIEAVRAADVEPGHLLEGAVDADAVHPVGHSAGGGTSLRLLERPDVTSAIPLAAGVSLLQILQGTGPLLPPDKAVTYVAARNDGIVPIDNVRTAFDYTPGPRRTVELGGSGHVNAFTDLCEIGDGGVAALAVASGLPVPEGLLALGNDGCPVPPFKDSAEVWDEVRHFVTAELRFRSGVDPDPVGLGDQVLASFDDVLDYRHNP